MRGHCVTKFISSRRCRHLAKPSYTQLSRKWTRMKQESSQWAFWSLFNNWCCSSFNNRFYLFSDVSTTSSLILAMSVASRQKTRSRKLSLIISRRTTIPMLKLLFLISKIITQLSVDLAMMTLTSICLFVSSTSCKLLHQKAHVSISAFDVSFLAKLIALSISRS